MERTQWIVIMILTGLLAAVGAGLLAHAGGVTVPMAILTGGGAFLGTDTLFLGLLHYGSGGPT
ncbi:hypothetical protein ACIA5C_31210 [Actinoplanes sp. NPDC051343]|uniref:hypothetical protein n=1 Tax=Actinoplanes sp. NPDC051343 TaxID=3363906 RepID=UPI0037B90988